MPQPEPTSAGGACSSNNRTASISYPLLYLPSTYSPTPQGHGDVERTGTQNGSSYRGHRIGSKTTLLQKNWSPSSQQWLFGGSTGITQPSGVTVTTWPSCQQLTPVVQNTSQLTAFYAAYFSLPPILTLPSPPSTYQALPIQLRTPYLVTYLSLFFHSYPPIRHHCQKK